MIVYFWEHANDKFLWKQCTRYNIWNTNDFVLNRLGAILTKIVWRISPHKVKGLPVLLAQYSKTHRYYINKYNQTALPHCTVIQTATSSQINFAQGTWPVVRCLGLLVSWPTSEKCSPWRCGFRFSAIWTRRSSALSLRWTLSSTGWPGTLQSGARNVDPV
jgi:hypothetical protein